MATLEMTFRSNVLHMDTEIYAILPEARNATEVAHPDKKYPVVYCLHGFGDNHSAWIRKSTLEFVARDLDVIVICPKTYNGFYVDGVGAMDYLTYLTEELPTKVANFFPASTRREDTFIMGNSMGGYGAFHTAMLFPERYAAAVSFSGALALDFGDENAFMSFPEGQRAFTAVFGEDEQAYLASDKYLPTLAKRLDASVGPKPRLYHFCGIEDPLTYATGKAFMRLVREQTSLEVKYDEGHGGHNWAFWNPFIPKAFEFFGFELPGQAY